MKAQSQPISITYRWERPIAHTFFVGVMMVLGVVGTAGRAFWATTLAPDQPPVPLWATMLLCSVALVFVVLWVRSAVVAFRDVRTRFTTEGILRPVWFQEHIIMWSDIGNVTITPRSVVLTTPQATYCLTLKSFRQPEHVLCIIRDHVAATTSIHDRRGA